MAWIKLDDQIAHHPKFTAAGPVASWLFIGGLAYCARFLTDGHIPASALPTLGNVPTPAKHAATLVKVGLWEKAPDGYRIHDYLDYQPTREEVERRREERRLAGSRGGRRSSDNRAKQQAVGQATATQVATPVASANVTTSDQANGVANFNPVPDPDPRASSKPSPREGAGGDFWQTWRALFERTQHGARVPDLEPRRTDAEHVVALVRAYPDPAYLAKMAELFLRLDVPDLRGKPRSIGLFRHWAPWCDTELRSHNVRPAVPA